MSYSTMKAIELRAAFLSGRLSKPEFIEAMFEWHDRLFAYAELLRDSDIENILLSDGQVTFVTRTDSLVLSATSADHRTAPFEILNFQSYERTESRLLLSLVQSDATVLDIGANVGWYSLTIAKRNPSARIYAFEPVPQTHEALLQNLRSNPSISNVRPFRMGLGEVQARVPFFYNAQFSSKSSAANLTDDPAADRILVEIERLDDWFEREGLTRVDLIKCDIEGGELMALRGGVRTLGHYRPIVFCELLRKWAARFGYHPNAVLELMADLGYRCFAVADNRLVPCSSIDQATTETNFVFLHPERHHEHLGFNP